MSGLVFTVPLIVVVVFVMVVIELIEVPVGTDHDEPGDVDAAAPEPRSRGPPADHAEADQRLDGGNRPYPLTPSCSPRRRRAQAHQPGTRARPTEETPMIDTTDANAVLDALQWLTGDPTRGYRTPVTDTEAADAIRHLATRAATELAHTNPGDEAAALVDQLRARRASDTAAQAFCAAVDDHRHHNGVLPDWAEERYQAWKAATNGN